MSYRRPKQLKPPKVTRKYKKLYVIAVEGDKAENQYFNYWKVEIDTAVVTIQVIPPDTKSAPQHVFEKLQAYDEETVEGTIERWMVIDRDQWLRSDLADVVRKCRERKYKLCVSNPSFEFWLLLHFENGEGIEPAEEHSDNRSVKVCIEKLREERYLQGYNKKLTKNHWGFLREKLERAIRNAKELDTPPCKDYPKRKVGSTVYRLVEKLVPILENSPAMPD